MNLQQTQQATVPVHQHILSLATSPYGDNPIFKDLKPLGSLNEDALKPTNPAAQKAILESSSSQYKISPKVTNGLKVKPIGSTLSKVNDKTKLSINSNEINFLNFYFRNHYSVA